MKPIAERLREFKGDDFEFAKEFGRGCDNCTITCTECFTAVSNYLADEIEREQNNIIELQRDDLGYSARQVFKVWAEHNGMPMNDGELITQWLDRWTIMRPRYEDGEPVQFGDEVECCDGLMKSLLIFKDGSGTVCGEDENPFDACDGIGFSCDEPLKRPAHKVLDADGVEIKVGDTVWCIDNEPKRKWRVEGIHADKPLIQLYELDAIGDHSWGWVNAERFTHERPVFDANNERIKVGDTVWSTEVPTIKGTVTDIEYKVGDIVNVVIAGSLCEKYNFSPEKITHCEPDSLEKLRDDISGYCADGQYHASIDSKLSSWADRLTALIERDA